MLTTHVAALPHQPRQAGALGAEHQADALAGQVADVEQRAVGGVVEPDDPDPVVLQPGQRGRQARHEGDRHVLDGAGRRLGHGRGDVDGPVPGDEHTLHAGAVAVADDRPEVAGVGDAVDGDEERRPARPAALISSSRSASGSGAAKAMTPCGASLRARASSLVRATWAIGTRLALARATMSATPSSGVPSWAISSVEIQISWTRRRPARSSSRIAWRPSTWSPPRPLAPRAGCGSAARRCAGSGRCARRRRLRGSTERARGRRPGLLGRWRRRGAAGLPRGGPSGGSTGASGAGPRRGAGPAGARPRRPPPPALPVLAGGRPRDRRATDRSTGATAATRLGRAAPGSRRTLGQHGDGEAGDALVAPERAEALGPAALDRDRGADGGASRSCISSRIGRQLGLLADDGAVDVADRPPAPRPRRRRRGAAARSSRRRPAPGRCRGSAGRCRRARPRRAAPRRRRGRRRRRRCGRRARPARRTRTPPSTSGRSGSSPVRWTSKPWPTRTTSASSGAPRRPSQRRAQSRSSGVGDLAVPRLAGHRDDAAAERARRAPRRRCRRRRWRGRGAGRRPGTPAASARPPASRGRAWRRRRRRRRRP